MLEEDLENIRYGERLKDTHVYQHVEGLAKKVRKPKNFDQKPIDADMEKRQIDVFYKVGWQYEHHHSTMACDISEPLYVDSLYSSRPDVEEYYHTMSRFIHRLKKEHEDESAFRVELWDYLNIKQAKMYQGQNFTCAKITYQTILGVLETILQKYISNFNQYDQQDIKESYWEVENIFKLLQHWVENFQEQIANHPDIQEKDLEFASSTTFGSMLEFITNFVTVTDIVVNEKKSALINYQPMISHLTYLVHPVLFGIYAFYCRERILWKNEYEHDISKIEFDKEVPQEKDRLPEDIKHLQISKVVFINLDGYESEFNIELAKNMDKHLMYVSFPKFDNDGSEGFMAVNNRFFKKIFYKYTREMYEFDNSEYDVFEDLGANEDQVHECDEDEMLSEQDEKDIKFEFQLRYNPEKYYKTVEGISATKMEKNSNIYLLPISFKYMQQEFNTLFKDKKDASKYASYFVWFLIRDFVGDDIKRFNPKYIVFSYSGKINIIDSHFIRIMQELAEASDRKVIFFPNFTTSLAQNEELYDNSMNYQMNFGDSNLDLMRKFSQFLKISSGTYNLEPPIDREPILSKYKIAKVNNYIIGLLRALSEHEYDHLKNRISQIILKSPDIIISNGIKQCKEEIESSVPYYYRQLYEKIHQILASNENQNLPQDLEQLAIDIRQNLQQISEHDMQANTSYLISEIITNFYLQTSSEKLSECAYVFIKNHPEKDEFDEIQPMPQFLDENETVNYKPPTRTDKINGLYCITMKYNNGRERKTMPVYQNTELVYKIDQRFKKRMNGKKYCNLMIMNHIDDEMKPISYAGSFEVIDKKVNAVNSQRIEVFPITFNYRDEQQNPFILRTNWNYTETARFYILYWPMEYNILEAKLHSIQQSKYEPRILNQIYLAQIPNARNQRLVFNPADFDTNNLYPRKNCSSYELHGEDKVFIFGGFFDQQNNYLNLQTNITGLDFQYYDEDNRKCVVTNQKGTMYDLQPLKNQNSEMQAEGEGALRMNSYVRTRRDYEFYDLEQLCDLTPEEARSEEQVQTVLMIGGYGENFLRPYSLMSCNYYEIKIDKVRRAIQSIQRKFVYNRVLTSNVKGFIKNKGTFEEFPILENNIIKMKYLSPDHYVAHRSVYRVNKTQRDDKKVMQLDVKVKYFFGLPLFTNYRKSFCNFASKIGENYQYKVNDSMEFFLSHSQQGNHYLLVIKGRNQVELLRVQMEIHEHQNTAPIIYGLSNGSIVSIDVKNKNVFALVMHQHYTKNKYVLAECQLHDENTHQIILKPVHTFNQCMQQYSIFSPRKGQALLLHGASFQGIDIKDYYIIFGRKEQDRDNIKKNQIQGLPKISPQQFNKIQSFLCKDQTSSALEIKAYNFLLNRRANRDHIGFINTRLKLNNQLTFEWGIEEEGFISFEDEETHNEVVIYEIEEIRQLSSSLPANTVITGSIEKGKQSLLIKIKTNKKVEYYGDFSTITLMNESKKLFKVIVSRKKPHDVWNKSLKVGSHTKTISRYENDGRFIQ